MKRLLIPLVLLVLVSGCTQQTGIIETGKSGEPGAPVMEFVNISEGEEAIPGMDSCRTGDYGFERDCYTSLAYKNSDPSVCERMPEDNNRRQANRAFCLGFVAAAVGDLSICRKQENLYYRNTCETVYERYFFDPSGQEEFENLAEMYDSGNF